MDNFESLEGSNDDTTIISELLNSAEVMQTSTVSITNDSCMKMPLQQKDDLQIVTNDSEICSTLCDATKENMVVSLQENYSTSRGGFFTSTQFSGAENLNKMHIRHVHIPYILNGELYQIQTQDGENVTVKCCHCPPDRVYRGSVRSTGNFHMHIKRRHPDLLEKLHDMKVNALLERRDRLMRNRKIPHRNNRSRSTNSNFNSSDICSFKSEEQGRSKTSTKCDQTTEPNIMHTHKLKIKTVFQRHQRQQKEAEEMRNWNTELVAMPTNNLKGDRELEQPINYSLKLQETNEKIDETYLNSPDDNQLPQQLQEQINSPNIATQSFDNFTNLSHQTKNVSTYNTEQNKLVFENHANFLNSSISISCPSVISSYSSSHQYETGDNRPYNSFSFQQHNLSIIKPEHFLFGSQAEAIDLTIQTDSGVYSSSEDNDSDNNNSSEINDTGVDSQKTSTASVRMAEGGCTNPKDDANTGKWHELLIQVENSIRHIQREMSIRNQIESNRLFLDIAKFRFLNPGFQFNW